MRRNLRQGMVGFGCKGPSQRTLMWSRDPKAETEGDKIISGERVCSRQRKWKVQRP